MDTSLLRHLVDPVKDGVEFRGINWKFPEPAPGITTLSDIDEKDFYKQQNEVAI